MIRVAKEELHELIVRKLTAAGLSKEHSEEVANHLVYADLHEKHSHGAMRVEYYAERISKGGINTHPVFTFKQTGPGTGTYDGDNGVGFVIAKNAMEEAIRMAKENGVAVVCMKRMSHCGTLSYYLRMAADQDLIGLSMCQSDPMVVPYGGTRAFFGTNPIGVAVPVEGREPVVFDMATTVGAWGKILDARSKNAQIPDTWAVDEEGNATTDPFRVRGLLPIAGPKGYGLMMMVDMLSGVLSGAPFGPHVTSMYEDLDKGRELGQIHIVIDPERFCGTETLKKTMAAMLEELHQVPAAQWNKRGVMAPGESSDAAAARNLVEGIPMVEEIYDYLKSDVIHTDRYDCGDPFAVKN